MIDADGLADITQELAWIMDEGDPEKLREEFAARGIDYQGYEEWLNALTASILLVSVARRSSPRLIVASAIEAGFLIGYYIGVKTDVSSGTL